MCGVRLLLLKDQGAYTELISIGPKLARICYLNDTINCCLQIKVLPVTEHTDEYHRSTSCPNRRQPDYSCYQDQE